MTPKLPIIKVVGVSASGKSTLVQALRAAGYDARSVSQEHAHVPDLWMKFDVPRVLIYLDNHVESQRRRRPDVTWDEAMLTEERKRLRNARAAADLRIHTADLTVEQVRAMVLAYLKTNRIRRASDPLPVATATGAPHAKPVKRAR